MLVVFRGLPGTGKSFLVKMLVERGPDLLVLSRDELRPRIVPRPTFGSEEKRLIDDLIVALADLLLRRGRSVVIDGMALSSRQRVDEFAETASRAGSPFRLIECRCAEATALARIAKDSGNQCGGSHPAGDRGEAQYWEVKQRFQDVAHPFLILDTDLDAEANLRAILDYIRP